MILGLLGVRSSIADWNDVPTGSMNPTIIEGDRIFVNKLAYDLKVPFTTWHVAEWNDPRPGEIVVFYSPVDGTRYVKRLIAGPGDIVEMTNDRLIVNGAAATYGPVDPTTLADFPAAALGLHVFNTEKVAGRSHAMMVTPGARARRDFPAIIVPAGKYLLLGDNRDNSFDSRYWGFADRSQIVGRAEGVVLSFDYNRYLLPRWKRTLMSLP